MSKIANCELCGEPMPEGEEMFKFHGFSGQCPVPQLSHTPPAAEPSAQDAFAGIMGELDIVNRQRQVIDALSEQVERLTQEWKRECNDTDKALAILGLRSDVYRTEGGSLHLPRIKTALRERAEAADARVAAMERDNARLREVLTELIAALDNSASADAGRDDVAAMLRYADAEQQARAALGAKGAG